MFKNHIDRLKSKISEMEDSRVASEGLQRANQERLEQQERTIASNALLLEALRRQHANVLADKVSLNLTIDNNALLLQTVQAEHAAALQARQEARDSFVAEVARLRAENDALVIETTSLKCERNACKKKEANAKRSVLRSFDWREEKVDASVLRGAVAFWGATAEVVDEADEDKKRRSNKARQKILQIIVEQGFNGGSCRYGESICEEEKV
jgi:hypothetical protein